VILAKKELEPATRLVAVGSVDHRSARVWVRSDAPGPHTIELHHPDGRVEAGAFDVPDAPELDGTASVRWPDDLGLADLGPHRTYTFEIRRGEDVIGAGRFVTAPRGVDDAPESVSIAIGSCNQPFAEDGSYDPEALALLDGLEEVLDGEGVEQVLLLGDQMYTDLPPAFSLLGEHQDETLAMSRSEVRAALHRRYRAFWSVPSFQRLQSRFATLCVLDDHEVCDNFGSAEEHSSPRWAAYREGALDAFFDYEALRHYPRSETRPRAFPTRFARGPIAGLVLDDRSERVMSGDSLRIFGDDQWAALEAFLREEAHRPVLIVGIGVPFVHEPEWFAGAATTLSPPGSAADDRWTDPKAQKDHDRLLRTLYAHQKSRPEQRLLLVSGDVHVGTAIEIRFPDATPILQLVSSGLTNVEAKALRVVLAAMPMVASGVTTADDDVKGEACLIPGIEGANHNPYTGLNAGIVTVRREDGGWKIRLRLLGARKGVGVVFDSGWK
jgi:alkaline phosphatase D